MVSDYFKGIDLALKSLSHHAAQLQCSKQIAAWFDSTGEFGVWHLICPARFVVPMGGSMGLARVTSWFTKALIQLQLVRVSARVIIFMIQIIKRIQRSR